MYKLFNHRWVPLGSVLDSAIRVVKAYITGAGTYALFAQSGAIPAGLSILGQNSDYASVNFSRITANPLNYQVDLLHITGLIGAVYLNGAEDAIYYWSSVPGSGKQDLFTSNLDGSKPRRVLAGVTNGLVTGSGDGKAIAIAVTTPGSGNYVFLSTADGVQVTTLAQPAQMVTQIASNAAGTLVAVNDGTSIKFFDQFGNLVHNYATAQGGLGFGPDMSFSPSGAYLAYGSQSYQITVMNISTGAVSVRGGGNFPSWSPDGTHLVCSSTSGIQVLTVFGPPKVESTASFTFGSLQWQ